MAGFKAWWLQLIGGKTDSVQPETAAPASPDNTMDRILEIIRAREAAVQVVPPCDFSQYRAIVSRLPRPSDDQIDNYVQFASEAHSWYKHLPLLQPGTPFRFFIDPTSGCDRIVRADGRVTHRERTDVTERFHYTWMKTSEYRSRFGYLAYDADAGSRFVLPSASDFLEYAERPIFATAERGYRIPPEVATAGSVPVTAAVHHLTARVWVWTKFLPAEAPGSWPIETGGNETLEAIKSVCERVVQAQGDRLNDEINADLVQLLEPEKRRLQQEMGNAIRRVVQLAYE